MTAIHSKQLSVLLGKKVSGGLLNQCRKKAFWHGIISHTDLSTIRTLMGAISKAGGLSRPFTYGTADKTSRRSWIFLFDCDEPAAVNLVETKVVRGKVPHSMLIKMVVTRLTKVDQRVQVDVTRELLTPEGFQKAVEKAWNDPKEHTYKPRIPWYLGEIEYLLSRDEMTQELFTEAWDVWKVGKVMES